MNEPPAVISRTPTNICLQVIGAHVDGDLASMGATMQALAEGGLTDPIGLLAAAGTLVTLTSNLISLLADKEEVPRAELWQAMIPEIEAVLDSSDLFQTVMLVEDVEA